MKKKTLLTNFTRRTISIFLVTVTVSTSISAGTMARENEAGVTEEVSILEEVTELRNMYEKHYIKFLSFTEFWFRGCVLIGTQS